MPVHPPCRWPSHEAPKRGHQLLSHLVAVAETQAHLLGGRAGCPGSVPALPHKRRNSACCVLLGRDLVGPIHTVLY